MYKITDYTLERAKELNLNVFPSDNPKYKIEVYDGLSGEFLFYAGDPTYSDYPTYLQTHTKDYANKRRRLYYARHKKGISRPESKEAIVAYLLW